MPTGYTSDLYEGKKAVTFAEFASRCARAFGALIELRDESLSAPIPDEFKPASYHGESLVREQAALAAAEAMTGAECERAAQEEYASLTKKAGEHAAEIVARRSRYAEMLQKVVAWTPPSPDHLELKNFMISQLKDSIDHDCSYLWPLPVYKTGAAWKTERLEGLRKSIAYDKEHHEKDVERARERTEWVKALKESLGAVGR